ncbi:MAG: hypothetical protein ACJAYU_003565 [Bradymonadia bacterium]|jgi:uncharacterized protein YbbC (DUF1343 family)
MISVNTALDPLTGIPTVSLYGDSFESLAPTVDQLADLDVVVIDLQDVGARYYTYVYTAMMTAEAASAAGVDVLVLDRPNPIAAAIEGPDIQDGFESFVGMLPLPNRHGLTLAEVLRYASNRGRGGHVQVISAEGWQRDAYFDEHDAPWVMPSPNMPTLDTAIVYPGMCLLEGTNASEGRGWTRPFEVFGAPYVDAYLLAETLRGLELPGVLYRPLSFEPTFQKWGKTRCSGLQVHVSDRSTFNSYETGAAIVWAMASLFDEFGWRDEAYEFVEDIPAIDLLFGSAAPREAIERGCTWSQLRSLIQTSDASIAEVKAVRLPDYD